MKILAIDDEKLICWALKRSFEKKLGYSVSCVHTGGDALKSMSENTYDAIITDLNLPDINGVELIRQVREMGMNIPVVVISSHFTLNAMDSILQYGVARCISKPFQIEDVITGVREASEMKLIPQDVTTI